MVTSSGTRDAASTTVRTISDSLSLKLALVGIVLVILGLLVQDGAIPAFMVIWGTAFFLMGAVSYIIIRVNSA